MLEVRGLSKRFGPIVALDDLSMWVPPGEVVGLLGPNGSGKTTAMRIVFGVIDADAGEVRYKGEPLGPEVRRRFGYMPEERGLYPEMRVRDHLVYLARLAGTERGRARRRTDELLERLGIADRADDTVERLSLGNQQRVQLAASLVHDPEALVLDEPFSGLDPVAVAELSQIVRESADEGRVVLLSSHQLELVEDLCESVAIVDDGRLVMAGAVDDLRERSGRRELLLGFDGPADPAWAGRLPGVRGVAADDGELRLELDGDVDPLAVLDEARRHGPVSDFGLRRPSLQELFLDAVEAKG
jgi:ABC-2 type transport system ATP-binding protein